ncbi:MAG: barstar family protein [Herminiimonas sp.]|nr:barstar family protein [Herminiimonas sp.]
MATVELNGAVIVDATTFHAESRRAFGFPEFYGASMDAWIDCLSYLRDDDGMASVRLQSDEILTIVVRDSAAWRLADAELLDEVTFCVAMINERYADYGEKPALLLKLS